MVNQQSIRNFAIIAHIDHGKSTLADRLIEMTGTITKREMREQLLDSNPIERERGITIKLAPVRMMYRARVKSYELGVKNKNSNNDVILPHTSYLLPHENSGDKKEKLEEYILNLIDTPGHVDFTYEVSRSLAACEGALLVVDATQGVQAQTLANLQLARNNNLKIIPLINKIDLPNARIEETRREIVELGFADDEIIEISAKTGKNVDQVLEAIVERIPAPKGVPSGIPRALIFSSQYDLHKGVVVFVRVVDGSLPFKGATLKGIYSNLQTQIRFLASGAVVTPIEIGYFIPSMMPANGLENGEVGYIATGLKDVRLAKVGDTITAVSVIPEARSAIRDPSRTSETYGDLCFRRDDNRVQPLFGYKEPKPMVFVGLYPIEQDNFTKARESMEKYRLSDSAFSFRPVSSAALGNGFHCGFLGLLHAEIVQERLSREYGLDLLATSPSVEYRVQLKHGVNPGKAGLVHGSSFLVSSNSETQENKNTSIQEPRTKNQEPVSKNQYSITSPSEFPDPTVIEGVREPIMSVTIFSPKRYVGVIMQLCQEKRGEYVDMTYHGENAEFSYMIPLSEMIVDFFDRLKSVTEGYASLDYEFFEYQRADVIKVDILVNKEKVDALSFMVIRSEARARGKHIVERLSEVLPRQQFSIPIQAAIGGEIIARDDIKPYRKDVIQKLYGGDRTRKDKLLKKQKKGKARMKVIGSVEIPQTAFFDVLRKH